MEWLGPERRRRRQIPHGGRVLHGQDDDDPCPSSAEGRDSPLSRNPQQSSTVSHRSRKREGVFVTEDICLGKTGRPVERKGWASWIGTRTENSHGGVHLMDDKRHKSRRRDRSRDPKGGSGGGWHRHPRRKSIGCERDGNIAPKGDVWMNKCSNCGGPSPDKMDLCRHCAKGFA